MERRSPASRVLDARVIVVLSTGHRLDVRVTDAEASKVLKQLARFAAFQTALPSPASEVSP